MTKKGANSLKLFKQFFGYFFNKVTPEHANASSSTIDNWFNSHAHEAVAEEVAVAPAVAVEEAATDTDKKE